MKPLVAPPPSRSPWQGFYGTVLGTRRRWWARRAHRLPCPVVSIGNLHFGGTGKTPLTAAVAAHLRDRGRHVAILSRGYGSQGKGVRVVSQGQGPMLGPRIAGDEPVLLASLLPGVAVVVCPDRHRAGQHALERLDHKPDLFLLDDGFSHLPLARDVDILAFPASDPWAGGRLAPGGRLREPLRSVRHADAVVLTGSGPDSVEEAGPALANALHRHGFDGPGFASATRPGTIVAVHGEAPRPGDRVIALAGIARPERFIDAVKAQGFDIARELLFPDHHDYPEATIATIGDALRDTGATAVVTTGKDRVKLQGHLELPLAELPIEAVPATGFFEWLDGRLQ